MIPIKNRKKNLEATVEEMRNFAFVYIEKYAPSKQQLRTYLLKKYLKTSIPNVSKKNVMYFDIRSLEASLEIQDPQKRFIAKKCIQKIIKNSKLENRSLKLFIPRYKLKLSLKS